MDCIKNFLNENMINTLIGTFLAFILGFVAFSIQRLIVNNKEKKQWTTLIQNELITIQEALSELRKNLQNISYINIPIIDSFIQFSNAKQLFKFKELSLLCKIKTKVKSFNTYIDIIILNTKKIENIDKLLLQKIDDILTIIKEAQKNEQ